MFIAVAFLILDFEHVISHHIQHDDFSSALEVLTKQVIFDVVVRVAAPVVIVIVVVVE